MKILTVLAGLGALALTSCNDNLTRDKAAQAIAPQVTDKIVAQDTIDTHFNIDCWVPNNEALRLMAGQFKSGQRPLPQPLNDVAKAGLIKDVVPVALIVSQTKGYIYRDCFGVDMTPKNNFNGYPSNYLNLQTGLFRIELSDEIAGDILRRDKVQLPLGYGSAINGVPTASYEGARITLVLAKTAFGAVTGLSAAAMAGMNETLAEFDYSVRPTKSGASWAKMQPRVKRGSAVFRKYDDGWRLIGLTAG